MNCETMDSDRLSRCTMTTLRGAEKDRFLRPGTLVRLSIKVNDRDMLEPDCGVVIRCWKSSDCGLFDCLVAFVGRDFSLEDPIEDPYFSIFAASSLAEIDPEKEQWPM
jgi:hypothetical protein